MTALAAWAQGAHAAETAIELLRRHGDHSSAFLALNQETYIFVIPEIDGFIAYRNAGRRHLLQLCGPFADPADRLALLHEFLAWADVERRRVTAVQLRRSDAELYAREGFVVNQLGSSYSIDIERFTLHGTRFFKVRNKISRARRAGVTVEEVTADAVPQPSVQTHLDAIDAAWLRGKGRFAKELAFMVGERVGPGQPYRRLFLARQDEKALGYVTYSPCYGEQPGWLYDLTRRVPAAPPGVIELVFYTALEQLREEGCRWLHLGLTPLVGIAPEKQIPDSSSALVSWLVRQIGERGSAIYPAKAQEAFKLKWAPHVIDSEFVAFDGRPSLGAVTQLLRVTRAI